MPPPSRAKWTTRLGEIAAAVSQKTGDFAGSIPLYDNGVKQGEMHFRMTADRQLVAEWVQEPGAVGLTDFRAWSRMKRST